jgi:hypothetical protein
MPKDRMELPPMEPQTPTLLPPTAYSIAPLGLDVPKTPPRRPADPRLAIGTFVMGLVVGGLMTGIVVRSRAESAIRPAAAPIQAPAPTAACPPPAATTATPEAAAPTPTAAATAADTATGAGTATADVAAPVKHRAAPRAATRKRAAAPAATAPVGNTWKPKGNDNDLMRAINQSMK